MFNAENALKLPAADIDVGEQARNGWKAQPGDRIKRLKGETAEFATALFFARIEPPASTWPSGAPAADLTIPSNGLRTVPEKPTSTGIACLPAIARYEKPGCPQRPSRVLRSTGSACLPRS